MRGLLTKIFGSRQISAITGTAVASANRLFAKNAPKVVEAVSYSIMPLNVEIKARVKNYADLMTKAKELSGSQGEILQQEDTFFACPNGRLKLRILKGSPAELIYYDRPDQMGPKLSKFHKTSVNNPEDLKEVLSLSLGVRGVVKKKRYLYMVGQTRVHVDQVEGLGEFMELEVGLMDGQSPEDGQAIASDLMQKLGINEQDLLTCAYMDLILKEKSA